MCDSRELLLGWLLVLAVGGTEHVFRPGRKVCAVGAPRGPESESFVQRAYQPYLTTCDGHRACSTYRTIYRTAYRRSPGPASTRPRYACCPGWKRTSGLPRACGAAVCQPPCQNGGSCVRPGHCHCPPGWQGDTCQTDVDECSTGRGPCPQHCINTAGSYSCRCQEGHSPSADGALCLPERGTPRLAPNPTTGTDGTVEEEVRRLRSRVDVLEQVRPGPGPPPPNPVVSRHVAQTLRVVAGFGGGGPGKEASWVLTAGAWQGQRADAWEPQGRRDQAWPRPLRRAEGPSPGPPLPSSLPSFHGPVGSMTPRKLWSTPPRSPDPGPWALGTVTGLAHVVSPYGPLSGPPGPEAPSGEYPGPCRAGCGRRQALLASAP
uniref:EGF like domain multiple 7 n=1 Tax=Felis catus TaxID=9685 RepID=A0ABI8A8L0_FELCA